MRRSIALRGAYCVIGLLLAACAPLPIKPGPSANVDLLNAQMARERVLDARPDWSLSGRLGVSDGRDSGSGSLQWRMRDSGRYLFSVHAPVTGKTWTLRGDDAHAVLEGLREAPVEGRDASDLLQRELGWRVPVAQLAHWVRGARAGATAKIMFRDDGLPSTIDEDGWHIEYPEYDSKQTPPLPTRVFASSGAYKVRLAIRDWTSE